MQATLPQFQFVPSPSRRKIAPCWKPSPAKIETPSTRATSNSNTKERAFGLEFESWCFSGVPTCGIGAWYLPSFVPQFFQRRQRRGAFGGPFAFALAARQFRALVQHRTFKMAGVVRPDRGNKLILRRDRRTGLQ